jgi:hypothetical protein
MTCSAEVLDQSSLGSNKYDKRIKDVNPDSQNGKFKQCVVASLLGIRDHI